MYNYRNRNFEPINEMGTIGWTQYGSKGKSHFISVDSSPYYIGNPYFKFYDTDSPETAKHVARISFLVPKYVYHKKDSLPPFILNSKQRRILVEYMDDWCDEDGYDDLTNWEYSIIMHNREATNIPWKGRQWKRFNYQYIHTHQNEINNTYPRLKRALPIDLPMPNYLLLR